MTDREGEGMGITRELRDVADRIDERFSRELQAKQDEVDALLAKLEVSIPLPLDADGVLWTGEETHFIDALGEEFKMSGILWDGESWSLCDETRVGQMYGFYACRHVASEPPESIEDVRRTVGRGYTYRERTCTMTEYVSGEPADYDCDDTTFHCERCGHEYSVYEQDEDGDTYPQKPRFCPYCGARVVSE